MSRLFLICTDVFYTYDEGEEYSLNETVIHEVFEASNRAEADTKFSSKKLKTLRSKVIKNRLTNAGFNVQPENNPKLDSASLFSLHASPSLCTQFPNIVLALKSYQEELEETHCLKHRIAQAIQTFESSKTYRYLFGVTAV